MNRDRSLPRRSIIAAACVVVLLLFLLFHPSSYFDAERKQRFLDYLKHPSYYQPTAAPSQTHAEQSSPPAATPSQSQEHSGQSLQPSHSTCNVILVTMLYGAHVSPEMAGARESHRRQSERWGCGFEGLDYDVTDRRLYSKHYFLLEVMIKELAKPEDQRREWLMWVDADAIIINPSISPEIFLPPDELKDVYALVSADQNGLNNGIFYLRVNSASLLLLTQSVAYEPDHPDEDVGYHGEQAAMALVIEHLEAKEQEDEVNYPHIVWMPRPWFNTYEFIHDYEGVPGHMLVHFAGLAEGKKEKMGAWLEELKTNQKKWDVPFEDSPYKDVVATFWQEIIGNATSLD